MGKISEAFEKKEKEKSIRVESLSTARPKRLIPEERETAFVKEFYTNYTCSPKLVVLSAPSSVDAESFKILRAQILFGRNGGRPRTIMVTSAFPSEGKTFVATNLAVTIALGIDEHVLLVDSDLRHPQLHAMLGCMNSEGLHEHLTGKKQLQDLIIRTQIGKLSLLTAGTLPQNPAELLSSAMMEQFLKEVKDRYQDRFIVIDSAPTQGLAEAGVLAKYVDAIILVVMAQKTPRDTIQKTVHNLGKDKILGVFFNGYTPAYKSYDKYYKNY